MFARTGVRFMRSRHATQKVFASAGTGIQSHGGKLVFGGGLLFSIGYFSPITARSLRSDNTSYLTSALVPRKTKSDVTTRNESPITTGEFLIRMCSLVYIFFPLLCVSPLLLLDSEDVSKWVYKLLRERLSAAGPLYIKWGQWASTRYDLLSLPLCNELNLLTQAAPQHNWEHTDRILREEFKGDYSRSLKMDKEAFASGSIAQAYRGTLGDKEVCIKVQHPNVGRVMETDICLIDGICTRIDDFYGTYFRDAFGQFATHLHDQLDFRLEKRNLETFKHNFKLWNFVTFPKPYAATEKVIVESFEPGHSIIEYIKLTQQPSGADVASIPSQPKDFIEPEARKKLGSLGLTALLKMIISDNFIHADLHPGNIIVRPAPKPSNILSALRERVEAYCLGFSMLDEIPQVCFLDAGLTSKFHQVCTPKVEEFFKSMLDHDGAKLAQSILDLSAFHGRESSEEAKISFVESMRERTRKWSEAAWSLESRTGDCMHDALNLVREHGIRLDTTLMVPLTTVLTLEGWQYELDPTVSVLEHVKQTVRRHNFFNNLATRSAHAMWKSAEFNTGIDEISPPSVALMDEWSQIHRTKNPDLI